MYAIVVLICLIYGVLSLILFFKVWGMTNDVRELKEALLFEVQKKNKESNLSYNSIQNAKKELADVEKQDEAELSLKEALEHQFVVAVKKYKVQCATNSVSKEKYQVGVQSIVKAYQRKAGEKLGYGIEDVVNAIGEILAQVRKSVDSPPGMLTEDHHHTVHEESQVCYSSHLRPKSLHL